MSQNEKITKSITLLREDFIQNVVTLCNTSGLPFFVMGDVLNNVAQQLYAASQKQLEVDRKEYQEQLNKTKSNKSE